MWTRPCSTRYDGGLVAGAYFGSPRTAPAELFGGGVIHDPRNIDRMDLYQSNRSGPSRTWWCGLVAEDQTGALRKPRSVTSLLAIAGSSFATLFRVRSGMVLIR